MCIVVLHFTFNVYVTGRRYGIMRKENYPKFARRLRIVTATSILALFSLMVAPSIASFAHAQSAIPGLSPASVTGTSTDIQALKDQVNTLKSVIQTLRAQLSQLATVQSLSVFTEVGQTLSIKPGQDLDSMATCPAGTQVTGGGFSSGSNPGNPDLHLTGSGPTVNGWDVSVFNSGNTNGVFASFARCASLTTSVNR
jgi:hypothetical protein